MAATEGQADGPVTAGGSPGKNLTGAACNWARPWECAIAVPHRHGAIRDETREEPWEPLEGPVPAGLRSALLEQGPLDRRVRAVFEAMVQWFKPGLMPGGLSTREEEVVQALEAALHHGPEVAAPPTREQMREYEQMRSAASAVEKPALRIVRRHAGLLWLEIATPTGLVEIGLGTMGSYTWRQHNALAAWVVDE